MDRIGSTKTQWTGLGNLAGIRDMTFNPTGISVQSACCQFVNQNSNILDSYPIHL